MPSIYQLKPAFQNLLRPFVQRLFNWGITANMVTLFAMLISIVVAGSIYHFHLNQASSIWLLLFPLWMLVRMALNAIDGMLAREFKQQSDLGAYYNELCDIISDSALYCSLIVFGFIHTPLLIFVIFLTILSEYTGVMAPLIGQQRRYDGPMGKSDRALWFSLITIVIFFFPYVSQDVDMLGLVVNIGLVIIAILLIYTIYNRIKHSLSA